MNMHSKPTNGVDLKDLSKRILDMESDLCSALDVVRVLNFALEGAHVHAIGEEELSSLIGVTAIAETKLTKLRDQWAELHKAAGGVA